LGDTDIPDIYEHLNIHKERVDNIGILNKRRKLDNTLPYRDFFKKDINSSK